MRLHPRRVLFATAVFITVYFVVMTLLPDNYDVSHDTKAAVKFDDDPILLRRRHVGGPNVFLGRLGKSTTLHSHAVGDDISVQNYTSRAWQLYWSKYKSIGSKRLWPIERGEETEDRVQNQINHVHVDEAGKKLKKILLYHGLEDGMVPGQQRFIDHGCPVSQCSLTAKYEDARTADLILFKDMVNAPLVQRPRDQIWVLFILESPHHTPSYSTIEVNWTATYRRDSTIVAPYERFTYFKNFTALPERPSRNYAQGKTKKVAWFVSNCGTPNGRSAYAKELQKHISVDVYGACGEFTCSRMDKESCNAILNRDYKFYLSFENSNCVDYITEKLFWNALSNDIVPVVMGARPEDYRRSAPPESYIHVDDFESPAALAAYLHHLDGHDDLYNAYFRWKGIGEFIDTKFWCRLCSMLHESRRSGQHMSVQMNEWWRGEGTCISPNTLPWSTWRLRPLAANVSSDTSASPFYKLWVAKIPMTSPALDTRPISPTENGADNNLISKQTAN